MSKKILNALLIIGATAITLFLLIRLLAMLFVCTALLFGLHFGGNGC